MTIAQNPLGGRRRVRYIIENEAARNKAGWIIYDRQACRIVGYARTRAMAKSSADMLNRNELQPCL